jgi:multidrug transporter EmrE-like cation transporter
MNTMLIAIMSIILSVAAQFSLKAGMSNAGIKEALSRPLAPDTILTVLANKFVLGGFVLYGCGAIVWLGVLSRWEVSKAYPLVGVGFGITVVVGLLLGEQVSPARVLGVALICAGVYLVGHS